MAWIKDSARWIMMAGGLFAGSSVLIAQDIPVKESASVKPVAASSSQAAAASAVTGESSGVRLTEWVLPDAQSQGWSVDKALGRLSFSVPLAQMPGEISFPIGFVMNGAFQAKSNTSVAKNEPIWGTVNLGYIADGKYSLENGKTYVESDFTGTTAGMQTLLGTDPKIQQGKCPLAKAFGFDWNVAPYSGWVMNAQADLIRYSFNSTSMFGPSWASRVALNWPKGFPILSNDADLYTVLMDKDIARVFIKISTNMEGCIRKIWLPILFIDRFGHYVSLRWYGNGLYGDEIINGYHINKVVVYNQRDQGFMVRWGHFQTSDTYTKIQDLARIDFDNIAVPSMLIQGYPGHAGALPSGYQASLNYAPGAGGGDTLQYGFGEMRPPLSRWVTRALFRNQAGAV